MITNQSIGRTFKIVELLAYNEEKEEFSLDDISKATSLNISTTYRFLENLIQIGIVEKNEKNKKYRLTLELYKIGSSILHKRSGNIVSYAIQSIKLLSRQYNETINLYTFEKGQAICIYRIENSNSPVSYSIKIGSQHPAYCTAAGKIFLSYQNKDDIESYFNKIKVQKYTKNTQTDINKIKKELVIIKENGYALDKEEYMYGANCLAVPILSDQNNVNYSISIVLPRSRVDSYNLSKLICDLKKKANNISNNIKVNAVMMNKLN